jgi:hypothetical protein
MIIGPASVCIYTGAALGHPGRNFSPLLAPAVSKSSLLIRLFNRGSHPFTLFENMILAWADASFQLVSVLPIYNLLGNYM